MNFTISSLQRKIFLFLYFSALIGLMFFHWQGYDFSIDWHITTQAEPENYTAYMFQKGPFQFDVTGKKYSLSESFGAGPVERYYTADLAFLGFLFFGLSLLITASSYLSRFWFISIMALFMFFMINLRLEMVGFFSIISNASLRWVLVFFSFIGPLYWFHSFKKEVPFYLRLLVMFALFVGWFLIGGVPGFLLQEQLISQSYFVCCALSILFLFLIAEENIFGILYLVTRSRGGTNNEKHFSIFSLVYLGILGMYYGKKSGLLNISVPFFDPYVLFVLSSAVAAWSIFHKRSLYQNSLSTDLAAVILISLGLITFSFLSLSMFRGNDPVYEGLHYLIVYAHLGFGTFFFFYLILNFVNPLSQGLQVYKIAYKEQNFPYITARLAGLVAVAAFFFLANQEAFLLFKAGYYNYVGAQSETEGEGNLASRYYQEGSIYGHDNHFSNYALGYAALQKNNVGEANYRFGRATLRYPSPFAVVNKSNTHAMRDEVTQALVSLKTGLLEFPGNGQIRNNLALIYGGLGEPDSAQKYLENVGSTGKWNTATPVNAWKFKTQIDTVSVPEQFEESNLAVQANMLSKLLSFRLHLPLDFDTTTFLGGRSLHRNAFLVNSLWYGLETNPFAVRALQSPIREPIHHQMKYALAWSAYSGGEVNNALRILDELHYEENENGKYLNDMGLVALHQHALPLAIGFFDEAIQANNKEAWLNKTAVLMESGLYTQALEWIEELADNDSSYLSLQRDLKNIISGKDLPERLIAIRNYYYYRDLPLEKLDSVLSSSRPNFVRSLWEKASAELLREEQLPMLGEYLTVFTPYLSQEETVEARVLVNLQQGKTIDGLDHPLVRLLSESDTLQAQRLYEYGNGNALNEPLVLVISERLAMLNEQLNYNLLVNAIDINPVSVALKKAYIQQSIAMGLYEYAETALQTLSSLLSAAEFSSVERDVLEQIRKRRAQSTW